MRVGRSVYRDKKNTGMKMHINLDKRSDYFFLKGIFQGGAQWEPWGARKKIWTP